MKRNWNAVREISCPVTRNAIATCNDPEILPRLQREFPECFGEGEEKVIGAWSWIKQQWELHAHKEYGPYEARHCLFSNWGEAVPMPYSLSFGRYDTKDEYNEDGPIPTELLDQLGKYEEWDDKGNALKHIVLLYQGSEWIVARMQASYNGLGALPVEEGEDSQGELEIVPKDHIVLDL